MDFNTKNISDFNYKDQPMLVSDIDCFKQEIEILFYTDPTEVINSEDWLDIGALVFDKSVSENQLKGEIEDYISRTCFFAGEFNYSVGVQFLQGNESDIGVITVNIDNSRGDTATAQYIIN